MRKQMMSSSEEVSGLKTFGVFIVVSLAQFLEPRSTTVAGAHEAQQVLMIAFRSPHFCLYFHYNYFGSRCAEANPLVDLGLRHAKIVQHPI